MRCDMTPLKKLKTLKVGIFVFLGFLNFSSQVIFTFSSQNL